jgi:hypothetical protein
MNSLEQNERQEPSDGEYVVSSRNGCPDHFRLLVQRNQRPLFAYLSSRLGTVSHRPECAQCASQGRGRVGKGARAVAKLITIHLRGQLRMLPADNFSYIDANSAFYPN